MTTYIHKGFVFSKGMEFNWFPGLSLLAVFIFLPKFKIYLNESFTKNLVSGRQISDTFAADVKARSIVNFDVKSFKVHFLENSQ